MQSSATRKEAEREEELPHIFNQLFSMNCNRMDSKGDSEPSDSLALEKNEETYHQELAVHWINSMEEFWRQY